MITAYLIRTSYRGIDDPPTSTYYMSRESAERRAGAANKYGKYSPDHRESRVEDVQIDAMWIKVEQPYINREGVRRIRHLETKARDLNEVNGVTTGKIVIGNDTLTVEYTRSNRKWRIVEKLRIV